MRFELKILNNIFICHLKVNSLPNKFDSLKSIMKNYKDIIVLTETKLDDSFPTSQFTIEGYSKPFRHDRNSDGGSILIYSREDIPCRELTCHTFSEGIEGVFIELNLIININNKCKWILLGTYRPPQKHDYYFENISNALNMYISKYKILLIGDFNTNETHVAMKNFLELFNLTNLVNENTCFKSIDNPFCIDLFITNSTKSFLHTSAFFNWNIRFS